MYGSIQTATNQQPKICAAVSRLLYFSSREIKLVVAGRVFFVLNELRDALYTVARTRNIQWYRTRLFFFQQYLPTSQR